MKYYCLEAKRERAFEKEECVWSLVVMNKTKKGGELEGRVNKVYIGYIMLKSVDCAILKNLGNVVK